MKTTQEWFHEANILYESGKFHEADNCLDKALAVDNKFMQAYRWKFKLFYSLGKYQDMIHWCDKAIEVDPDYFFAYNSRANALGDLGKFSAALENYDKAISIDPNHAFAHNGKAIVLMKLERLEEALESYDKAIEVDSDCDLAYNGKGSLLWKLGRLEEAKEAYDKSIEKRPKNTHGLCNRAKLLSHMGKQQEAITDFKRIKALYQSGYVDVHNNAEAQRLINDILSSIVELDDVSAETEAKIKNANQNNPPVQKFAEKMKLLQEDKEKITADLISNMDKSNTTETHQLMDELQRLITDFSELQTEMMDDSTDAINLNRKFIKKATTVNKKVPKGMLSPSKQTPSANRHDGCNVF